MEWILGAIIIVTLAAFAYSAVWGRLKASRKMQPAVDALFQSTGIASQPVPTVTNDEVDRVIRRDFPSDQIAVVTAMLDEYEIERTESGAARVRLACLKLADGNTAKLRKAVDAAKRDYRDVLGPAEYPEFSVAAWQLPSTERQRIYESDWKQYQDWLRR